jgi:predicted phage-related endonuclease
MRRRTGHIGMSEEARLARRKSIGGSDVRTIMSGDPEAVTNLWLQKRGEIELDDDFGETLLGGLGNITEPLNLDFFEKESGLFVANEQLKIHNPEWPFVHSTLDGLAYRTLEEANAGLVETAMAVVEAKFMLPFYFNIDDATKKYYPQVQHNMMCNRKPLGFLSIVTGGAQYHKVEIEENVLYQARMMRAVMDFWDCVQTGRHPVAVDIDVPKIERVRTVNMTGNNEWAAVAATLIATKTAHEKHDKAKKELKKLFPQDAALAEGTASRSHCRKTASR